MNTSDKFNDYVNSHPRECLTMVVIGLCLIWQSAVAVSGLLLYLIYSRALNGPRLPLLAAGVMTAVAGYCMQQAHPALIEFIKDGFSLNAYFWKLLVRQRQYDAFLFMLKDESIYVASCSVLVAGLLSVIGHIPDSPHQKTMKALHEGIHPDEQELSEKAISRALKKLREEDYDGTVLGVSKYTGKYVVMPDRDINQVVLVLGTTGGGKTVTLRRFYRRAIVKGYPLIIVDGKPDDGNIKWLEKLAEENGREFFGFNCANNRHYDPLTQGGYTELKDKIVCLKDEWSSDYYRSIAEDYLQTTFQVLLKVGDGLDLHRVVDCLVYKNLVKLVNATKDTELMKRVGRLQNYDMKDITGLQAHLDILINSEFGQFFGKDKSPFSLSDVITKNGVAYFALPALRFPSFSRVLGKLVINDIKAVVDRYDNTRRPIFAIFDEFSVFASEQVLNLVNMGRGKGVHAVFGTQGLGDLDRVDDSFQGQTMNCVNTVICHRLNDQESAEQVSSWIGTRGTFTVTAQIDQSKGQTGLGTVKRNREFIVHPDEIKQGLKVGEAFYTSKVRRFEWNKIRVIY